MKLCAFSLGLQKRLTGHLKTTNSVSLVNKRHLHYPLPWPRIDHRSKTKYFMGRILGKTFLRAASGKWSEEEFKVGVKHAIKEFANILNTPALREDLKNITSEELHSCIKDSLEKISTWTLGLQIHDLSNFVIGDIRAIAGEAPDDKRHVVDIWGHRMITSHDKLERILEESGGKSGLSLKHFTDISNTAFNERLQFQVDITFNTTESYWLTNEDDAIVEGSKDHPTQSIHKWTFGSELNRTEDYPFSWIIVNINDFIPTQQASEVLI